MVENTAEAECRQFLGDEDFEALRGQMATLPAEIDREAVYQAIADGVLHHRTHLATKPDDVRDLNEALDRVRRAIDKLKSTWQRTHQTDPKAPSALPAYMRGWWPGKDLERAYHAMKQGSHWLWFANRAELLDIEPPSKEGGRPRAVWRTATEARLRKLGVPPLVAKALVEAAGLTGGPTPTRR